MANFGVSMALAIVGISLLAVVVAVRAYRRHRGPLPTNQESDWALLAAAAAMAVAFLARPLQDWNVLPWDSYLVPMLVAAVLLLHSLVARTHAKGNAG